MALSKKSVSLSSIVWVCFCLGGVAISLTSGQTSMEPANTIEPNSTSPSTPVTTPANSTTPETGTTPTTPNSNMTTEVPPGNTTANSNDSTTAANSTAPGTSVTSPGPTKPTTSAKPTPPGGDGGRKFDAASFFGGIATAVGVCILIFVAVHCYTRSKKTSYHAM